MDKKTIFGCNIIVLIVSIIQIIGKTRNIKLEEWL